MTDEGEIGILVRGLSIVVVAASLPSCRGGARSPGTPPGTGSRSARWTVAPAARRRSPTATGCGRGWRSRPSGLSSIACPSPCSTRSNVRWRWWNSSSRTSTAAAVACRPSPCRASARSAAQPDMGPSRQTGARPDAHDLAPPYTVVPRLSPLGKRKRSRRARRSVKPSRIGRRNGSWSARTASRGDRQPQRDGHCAVAHDARSSSRCPIAHDHGIGRHWLPAPPNP
jgi:hypothetical protein